MIGTVLGTRYRILHKIGEGAMGQVYLAEHTHLGRKEAIKVLQPVAAVDPSFVSRFRREARATNRVQHPNIVSVYDFGQLPDGRFFLAIEYADGERLDHVLAAEQRFSVARSVKVLMQLASGIDCAHRCGVIHRDLKPSNLMLVEHRGQEDFLKILDFGLAKIVCPTYKESFAVTREGEVLGTVAYMAPEQLRAGEIDERCDIYAAGCIAYEMATGKPPFTGAMMQVMHGHITTKPAAPSERAPLADIPEAFDRIVLKCLEKRPDRRYQTGSELESALLAAFGEPTRARPKPAPRMTRLGFAATEGSASESGVGLAPTAAMSAFAGSTAEQTASHEGTNQSGLELDSRDVVVPREEMLSEWRSALLELAEALVDQGATDAELTIRVADARALDAEYARIELEREGLEVRDAMLEQNAHAREGPLRFAIGELQFDRDRAPVERRADLDHQVTSLERRLDDLLDQAKAQRDKLTAQGIELAAAQDSTAGTRDRAFENLARTTDGIIPRFEDELSLAPLIDRYQSICALLGGQSRRG